MSDRKGDRRRDFNLTGHAVDQYLERFLGERAPFSDLLKESARTMLQELVNSSRIKKTDYVRPLPYINTEVWEGRDWSSRKIFLFIEDGLVITVLANSDYTRRYRMMGGRRVFVGSKGKLPAQTDKRRKGRK